MSKVQTWLSGLLLAQVAIVAVMFLGDQEPGAASATAPLLKFDLASVDRVVVSDGKSSAELQKNTGQWVLPELNNLPANKTQLTTMLDKVGALSSGWPVATSESSHQRFEVAEDKFQRRLQLYQGEDIGAELFLGTSPGFRKVHLRPAGSEAVFSADLNTYDIPAQTDDWLDKKLLAVDSINYIKGTDYTLKLENDQWAFVGNTENNVQLDIEKAKQLSLALSGLRVQSLSSEKRGDSVMTLQVTGASGKWDYQFFKVDDQYLVNRSDRKEVFSISQYDYQRIAQIGLPQLAVDSAEPSEDTVEEAAESNS